MTVTTQSFARDFTASRERFLAAAQRASARMTSFEHPLTGPVDEPLYCDVASLGDKDAPMLLVLITGVHGVEHYPGSASICDWLETDGAESLPDGMGVLIVHAINPWGAAWCRRYTEDNVDLARNFLDFGKPLPNHTAYEEVQPLLRHMGGYEAEEIVEMLYAKLGERDAIEALMSGQYRYPEGFSFGGHGPTWSHLVIRKILEGEASKAKYISLVEFHSGLGSWGDVIAVSMQVGEDLDRARCVYGSDVIAPRVDEGTHSAPGHTTDGYVEILRGRDVTSVVLEFGTYPAVRSLPVLLADHWVHTNGKAKTEFGRKIAADNLEMHCPDNEEWQVSVLQKSADYIAASIKGLQQCQ